MAAPTTDPGDQLARLVGTWCGKGVGDYPTIERFEYDEVLRFEASTNEPLLHFEQRTTLTDGEPSHWEAGFVRWFEDGSVELLNAQNGTRVEVLRGELTPIEDGWTLDLRSRLLGNDERMVSTRRVLSLSGDRLTYLVEMATHTTPTPVLQQHLTAELMREVG